MRNGPIVVEDVLLASAAKVADGVGTLYRHTSMAISAELWVNVTALASGNPMAFALEVSLEDSDSPSTWVEIARISGVSATGQYAVGTSRDSKPMGRRARGRWYFNGGTGSATFDMKLAVREG